MRALCFASALVTATIARVAAAQDPDGRNEDVKGREEWFWAQRMYPFAERPYEAMARARAAASRLSPVFSRSLSISPLLGGSWRAIGPYGLFDAGGGFFGSGPQLDAGRVVGIAPSPVVGGPFIIATASGGVWRASALGGTWVPLTDNQCSLNTGAVTLDPVNPQIVYVGTGELNGGSYGCGVLRSSDGGNSWTVSTAGLSLTNGGSVPFGALLIDKSTAGSATSTVILGATSASNAGVVRSTNSGTNWSAVLVGYTSSLVAHPTSPGVFYAGDRDFATPSHRGVFRSGDHGATWTQLPQPPSVAASNIGRIELAVTPADPEAVFVLVSDGSNSKLAGVYRWDNTAAAWTQLAAAGLYTGSNRGNFGNQGFYDLAIAVDPRNAKNIYVGGQRAFRSSDGGATFTPMGNEIHVDWHSIVVDPINPDILYAGTDGGVFVSTDAGETWTSRNAGLTITQYYPGVSINPQGTMITGGTQDNGTEIFSGSPYWDGLLSGDGGYTAINYKDPTIMWAETQWGTTGGTIARKQNGSSRSRVNGIIIGERVQFIPPLVMDPVTPTKLYFGTFRLYRTVDDGANWAPISTDLSRGTGTITTIAIAPSDTLTIYVGTTDANVQVSHDGGLTFTRLIAGLPSRNVTRIIVDPSNASHVIATFSGFATGHIFESADAAVTWNDISGNLIDAPANSAAFIGNPGNLFVGTDVGVFQTVDDGATWQPGPTGIPNVAIMDLVYQPAANVLVAGTYGRGMFTYNVGGVAAVLRGDVNGDGKVDAFDALLIQQALVASLPQATSIFPRGDANCNGVIDSGDVVLVLRAAVGLPTPGACVGTVR
ncbi:MAG: dockerin type I domain-containing protein [Gemmatimonadaceae bacterium]